MQKIKTNQLFWILHIGGWLFYFALYTLIVSWYKEHDARDWFLYSLTYILGFSITLSLRYIYRNLYDKIEKLYWLPVVIVAGSVVFTIIWTYVDMYISHFFWENGQEMLKKRLEFKSLVKYSTLYTILVTTWSSLYFGIKYAVDLQDEKQHAQEAETMAQKAQMEMLRYQLNPHFLFNSLNSIRALVDENKGQAKEMITELSEFLRYSLLQKDATYVPLHNELEAVKLYFSIEKKRFEEKLEVNYTIADDVKNNQVLSFLLHPLIENAVKYGMKTSTMPLKINVAAQKTGYGLMLEVCNSGKWIDRKGETKYDGGTGTGLTNVERRLKNAYTNNYRFDILHSDNNICVRIEIMEDYLHG